MKIIEVTFKPDHGFLYLLTDYTPIELLPIDEKYKDPEKFNVDTVDSDKFDAEFAFFQSVELDRYIGQMDWPVEMVMTLDPQVDEYDPVAKMHFFSYDATPEKTQALGKLLEQFVTVRLLDTDL